MGFSLVVPVVSRCKENFVQLLPFIRFDEKFPVYRLALAAKQSRVERFVLHARH